MNRGALTSRRATATAGLWRSVWPTASIAPLAARRREHAIGVGERCATSASRPAPACPCRGTAPPSRHGARSARRRPPHRPRRSDRGSRSARAVFDDRARSPRPAPAAYRPRALSVTPSIVERMRAWWRPRWPTPITARRSASATRPSAIGRPTMAIEASLADLNTCSPSRTSVRPASIDSAVAPATRMAWMVARPITGTSKRMSWSGLGHLDDAHAGAGEVAGTADDFVGAFHRLDRDHRLVLDGDRLADVERGNRVGHPVAELEVGALLLVGGTFAQHARPGEQRREEQRSSSSVRSLRRA